VRGGVEEWPYNCPPNLPKGLRMGAILSWVGYEPGARNGSEEIYPNFTTQELRDLREDSTLVIPSEFGHVGLSCPASVRCSRKLPAAVKRHGAIH
jgi:hypothetical protein